jgi:uncharacterized protein
MIRRAALVPLLLFPTLAAAAPADCGAGAALICRDATLSGLYKEDARLSRLVASGPQKAQRNTLAQSAATFRKALSGCQEDKGCLQRTIVDHIFTLRQGYAAARSKDAEGISLGPFVARCPGLGALVAVTFVNSNPAFAALVWRDSSILLTQAAAASGARYTGTFPTGEAQFWNKGNEATLDLPGKPSLTCHIEQGG